MAATIHNKRIKHSSKSDKSNKSIGENVSIDIQSSTGSFFKVTSQDIIMLIFEHLSLQELCVIYDLSRPMRHLMQCYLKIMKSLVMKSSQFKDQYCKTYKVSKKIY